MSTTANWAPPRSAMSQNFGGLLDKLAANHGLADLDQAGFDAFIQAAGDTVILLVDEPDRVPESWDLAVIFPDLLKAAGITLRAGLLRPEQAAKIQPRFAINRMPALLLLRDGGYVGVIEGLRDWGDFVAVLRETLQRPVSRAPGIGISVVAPASTACH